ncbi:MAG: transposase [Chloroflexi bacterium]|nr:transposase [Chloroflexota bacterium]
MGTRFHPVATNYPHFVTTTTRDRRPVFIDDRASSLLIEVLKASRTETSTQLLAYVVMPDHVHLLVVPRRLGLGHFIRLVKGRFARYWNQHEGQLGALWQERYYETVIRTDAGLKRCIDYIHQNPVAAGLSEDAGAYPYSSTSWCHIPGDLTAYLAGPDTGQAEAWPSGVAQHPASRG